MVLILLVAGGVGENSWRSNFWRLQPKRLDRQELARPCQHVCLEGSVDMDNVVTAFSAVLCCLYMKGIAGRIGL